MGSNAQEYATAMHDGQKRWGGEAYIMHPKAVAESVAHLGKAYEDVAWLHDVIEDCNVGPADLLRAGFDLITVGCVEALTKLSWESYLDFILRCKNRNQITRVVKLADIEHNLSTCPLGKPQRDKWLLAQYILRDR